MPRGGSFSHFSHDHDCSEHDCSGAFSLYKVVDTARVRALNCVQPDGEEGVGKLFRAWEDRLNTDVVMYTLICAWFALSLSFSASLEICCGVRYESLVERN